MATKINQVNNFDISKLTFSEPRKNKKNGQQVLINYETGSDRGPLILQTPKLLAPFGVDSKQYDDNAVKYSINFSLTNDTEDTSNPVANFTNVINAVDNKVKTSGFENSTKWFGAKKSREIIDEFFKPCVKRSPDPEKAKKYPPVFQVKLVVYDGQPSFKLYDHNKQEIPLLVDDTLDLSCIGSNCYITCIVQCVGVYFMAGAKFGVSWKLVQAKIHKQESITGYAIVDPEDEETHEEPTQEDAPAPYEEYETQSEAESA